MNYSVDASANTNVDLANRLHEKAYAFKIAAEFVKKLPFEVKSVEDLKRVEGLDQDVIRLITEWLEIH